MAARRFARMTNETTFGSAVASPTAGNRIILDLTQANPINLRPSPEIWKVRSHGSSNRNVLRGTEQLRVSGSYNGLLFPSQAAFVLGRAATISGSPLELGSFTVDEVVVMEDSSRTKTYFSALGTKVEKLQLTANNSANGVLFAVAMDMIAKQPRTITVSDFAEPAVTDYPSATENPFVFQDTSTGFTLNGVALTNYASWSVTINNILGKDNFDESRYVQRLPWCGRDIMFSARLLFKTRDHRDDFEAQTARDAEVVIADGTTTTTLTFGDKCYIESLTEDEPMDNSYFLDMTWAVDFDATAGTDFAFTVV